MNEDLKKYLNIPYKFYNDNTEENIVSTYTLNPKTYNCATLARQFYKDHGYPETFSDGNPFPTSSKEKYIYRELQYLYTHFDREMDPDKLEYGDLVLLHIGLNGGIVVDNGNVLTIEYPCIEGKSKTIIQTKEEWLPHFKIGFKRKEKNCRS